MKFTWKLIVPTGVPILMALIPAPLGLPSHAWYYFAIFAGVIAGIIIENLPRAGVGLVGVTAEFRLLAWRALSGSIVEYRPVPIFTRMKEPL